MFAASGAEGFSERSRRELLATGEWIRSRTSETPARLTGRETHIARLAGDGQGVGQSRPHACFFAGRGPHARGPRELPIPETSTWEVRVRICGIPSRHPGLADWFHRVSWAWGRFYDGGMSRQEGAV